MPPSNSDCETIHKQYRALTGLDVPFTMTAYFLWSAYLARGLAEPDLACMIRYLKLKIKENRRPRESLLLANMIQDLDKFQEYLSMARAESRNSRTETPKQSILRAAGRPEQSKTEARPVKDIIGGCKAFEQWKQDMKAQGLL